VSQQTGKRKREEEERAVGAALTGSLSVAHVYTSEMVAPYTVTKDVCMPGVRCKTRRVRCEAWAWAVAAWERDLAWKVANCFPGAECAPQGRAHQC
jgi:hypothetical protein